MIEKAKAGSDDPAFPSMSCGRFLALDHNLGADADVLVEVNHVFVGHADAA